MPDRHECRVVLARVHEFLDGELDEATADAFRAHLAACEPCMDEADLWQALHMLVKRANPPAAAPVTLLTRITISIEQAAPVSGEPVPPERS